MALNQITRRGLLQGAAITAIIAATPDLAKAWPAHGSAGFNGGRSQVNTNFIGGGGDYPFINALHYGLANPVWSTEATGIAPPPSILNSDGYPTTLTGTGGGVYQQVYIPDQVERPGNWKITWTGNGTISLASNATLTPVSGSLTSSTGSGAYTFSMTSVTSPYLRVGISAIGSPIISNLQVYNVNDETDLLAGWLLTSKFINRMQAANFGVFRFMNWLNTNLSNATTWAYRKQKTHWSYAAEQFPPELYCGISTNASNAYSVSIPSKHSSDGTTWVNGDAPKDKDTITVQWNATAANATCTLQVGTGGSTSAITMVEPGGTVLSAAGNNLPTINRFSTLVYDADLNQWFKWGGDTALYDRGIGSGIPFEVIVEACQRIRCHPWVCFPAFALDPMTDYVTQAATYLKANLPSWAVPRFECANEVWNPKFFATGYGGFKANAHWSTNSFHEWMGKVNVTAGQAVNAVYGGTPTAPTKYQMICGVQTTSGNTVGSCQSSDSRLKSTQYFSQAAAAQTGYTKDHAYNWVSHIGVANYTSGAFGAGLYTGVQTPYETSLANTLGGVRFVGSVSGGNLTITHWDVGTTLSAGMTFLARGLTPASGVTVTGGSGTSWTISNTSISWPAGTTFYAFSNFQAAKDYIDTLNMPATFTGNIVGSVLTVTSTSSPTSGLGSIMPNMILSYNDASCFLNCQITTTAGTGTGGTGTYNLSNSPGDRTGIAIKGFWAYDQNMLTAVFANWKTWATGMATPVNKMTFYEGGYSPDYDSNGASSLDVLRFVSKFVTTTANKAIGLQGYLADNYSLAAGLTGGGYVAEFPSCFQLSGPWPSNNSWAVLEDIYQSPDPPQWNAIVAFNH